MNNLTQTAINNMANLTGDFCYEVTCKFVDGWWYSNINLDDRSCPERYFVDHPKTNDNIIDDTAVAKDQLMRDLEIQTAESDLPYGIVFKLDGGNYYPFITKSGLDFLINVLQPLFSTKILVVDFEFSSIDCVQDVCELIITTEDGLEYHWQEYHWDDKHIYVTDRPLAIPWIQEKMKPYLKFLIQKYVTPDLEEWQKINVEELEEIRRNLAPDDIVVDEILAMPDYDDVNIHGITVQAKCTHFLPKGAPQYVVFSEKGELLGAICGGMSEDALFKEDK